jgi:hypothetical protein
MYAPRVFVSMLAVLVVFAVSSFFISGSVLSAIIQTVICAVLIQAGYFIGVLYLVRRERLHAGHATASDRFARMSLNSGKRDELHPSAARNFPASDS